MMIEQKCSNARKKGDSQGIARAASARAQACIGKPDITVPETLLCCKVKWLGHELAVGAWKSWDQIVLLVREVVHEIRG